jgi:hypothetical protein
MATPVQPLIIRGPAIVIRDSAVWYTRGNVTVRHRRATFAIDSDSFGQIDVRAADQGVADIEFTPVGEIKNLVKYYPYGPTNLVTTNPVGSSIYGATDVPTVIHTHAGQTITYHRTGIARMPSLSLSPRKTAFGPMTIRALGKRGIQAASASYFKTIASAAFSDTSFDATKVETAVYSAALGSRTAPFNAIGARDGFEVSVDLDLDTVQDDNVGIADEIITGVKWSCKFQPNNLTEAQVDTLFNFQDTDAIIVGQSVARGPLSVREDLVITGGALNVTLHNVGIVSAEHGFGRVDRNGALEFVTAVGFTSGAPSPIASLVI